MILTDRETAELQSLYEKRATNTVMFEDEQQRLNYLQDKMVHNHCLNPSCVGHHGEEHETACPKCNEDLYKMNPEWYRKEIRR